MIKEMIGVSIGVEAGYPERTRGGDTSAQTMHLRDTSCKTQPGNFHAHHGRIMDCLFAKQIFPSHRECQN